MILVLGASGVVGGQVARQLVAAGEDVRVLLRDPQRDGGLSDQVKVIVGDLGQPETLVPALAGVEKVFLLSAGGPETPLHDANLASAAADAGVSHIVKLSIIGAEYGLTDLVSSWHLAGERTLRQIGARDGGPTWTFIRPAEFSSNARLWAGPVKSQSTVFWAQVSPKVAVVDPQDVAAVAVLALTSSGHAGKTYRISGPEALSVTDRVGKLAAALGREIKVVELPIPAVAEAAKRMGRQPLVVEATLGNLAKEEFRQHAAEVLPTVEELLGRPPITFDQWIADNIDLFR